MLVSNPQLEAQFVSVLGMCQPTIEYLNRLTELAAKHWEPRSEHIQQESRALNIRLSAQKRLNSQAIKAKLTGDLSPEDFETLKQNIKEETDKIESELNALEYERKTLEEMSQQAKLENVSFVATWRTAGIQGKLELQRALFPAGLVWSHETGFLNRKNEWLMEGLQEIFQGLTDPQVATQRFLGLSSTSSARAGTVKTAKDTLLLWGVLWTPTMLQLCAQPKNRTIFTTRSWSTPWTDLDLTEATTDTKSRFQPPNYPGSSNWVISRLKNP